MAHSISGVIVSAVFSTHIAARLSLIRAPLDAGLAFLPFDASDHDRLLPPESEPGGWAEDWRMLSSALVSLLSDLSRQDVVAYVETDYFGGAGGQGAVLFRNGAVAWGPEWGRDSINRALRLMGVRASDSDEFDEVGLGRARSNEQFRMAQERKI